MVHSIATCLSRNNTLDNPQALLPTAFTESHFLPKKKNKLSTIGLWFILNGANNQVLNSEGAVLELVEKGNDMRNQGDLGQQGEAVFWMSCKAWDV